MKHPNVAASVRARLLNKAKQDGQDFNLVLTRYAIERVLYRISISNHRDQFLLKGALLFNLWFDIPHRPTHDADLLGFGSAELSQVQAVFKEICSIDVADGMVFLPDTVGVAEIRKDAKYAGVRVTLRGLLDGARCPIQVDVGFGDAVTPGPEDAVYPVILTEFEAPRLRVYPRYTVVAEKFHALATRGIINSRMKDYFDLWVLAGHTDFDGKVLAQAILATFNCRQMAIPDWPPFGLTDAFVQDRQKQIQWQAFLRKNSLQSLALEDVVRMLSYFLMPAAIAALNNTPFTDHWPAGGNWVMVGDLLT